MPADWPNGIRLLYVPHPCSRKQKLPFPQSPSGNLMQRGSPAATFPISTQPPKSLRNPASAARKHHHPPSSLEFETVNRSPEVSSTAFDAQPLDLLSVPLMDKGFAAICQLAEHCLPHIQFLFISSRLCSTLLSSPASRRALFHPCVSLSLHLHQFVKRGCTSKLSIMARYTKIKAARPKPRRPTTSLNTISSLELHSPKFCRRMHQFQSQLPSTPPFMPPPD